VSLGRDVRAGVVSASPFRVPAARLAAAQAAVREKLGIKGPVGE
jgi:pyruvate,orthophosphate dikinase